MANVYDALVAQLYYLATDEDAAGDVRYFAELRTDDIITHADRVDAFLAGSPYARIAAGFPHRNTTVTANAVSIVMMWHLCGVDAHYTVATMMLACDKIYHAT